MVPRSILLAAVASLVGCRRDPPADTSIKRDPVPSAAASVAPAETDRLPAGWSAPEMLEEATTTKESETTFAKVIAFHVIEDDRPLRIEAALIGVRWKGKPRWTITNLYRHPKRPDAKWATAMVFDAPFVGTLDLDHPPTKGEVEKFVHDTWWRYESNKFKLLDSGVAKVAYRELVGDAKADIPAGLDVASAK